MCRCFKSQVPFSNEILINIAIRQSESNNTWYKYNESVCCQRTRAKMDINYHCQWVIFLQTNQPTPSTHYSGFHFGQPWGLICRPQTLHNITSCIRDLALFAWPLVHTAHPCVLSTALRDKIVFACVWSLIVKGVFLHGSYTVWVVTLAASSTSWLIINPHLHTHHLLTTIHCWIQLDHID